MENEKLIGSCKGIFKLYISKNDKSKINEILSNKVSENNEFTKKDIDNVISSINNNGNGYNPNILGINREKEEQERKKKRKKMWLTVGISIFLLLATLTGLSIKYGFDLVKDTIIGHDSKELLEGDWVQSEYGFPPILISTPKVLKRTTPELPEEMAQQIELTQFSYGSLIDKFQIQVATTKIKNLGENKIDLQQAMDGTLKLFENAGSQNIITKNEKFETPNGAEGLKVFGTMDSPVLGTDKLEKSKYVILGFTAESIGKKKF